MWGTMNPKTHQLIMDMKTRMPFSIAVAALGLWLTLAVSPLRAASNPSENPQTESPWGEPVEGVQARLRALPTNWSAGAIPRLFVDVRNQGQRHLLVQTKQMHGCELEVDGQWFRRPSNTLELRALPSPFPPGRQYAGIVINLDNYWEKTVSQDVRRSRRNVPERLRLTPGKHNLRVAVTATADKSAPGKPVRAICNPVEIEILPEPGLPRIGVYDSRSVATAYAGSARHEAEIRRLDDALKNAKASGDPARIKQADDAIWAARKRLHRQGLGTYPVNDILGQIPDDIGRIKNALRLTTLVSKWDQPTLTKYSHAEQIDVTEKLIDALKPGARQRSNAMEIQRQKPIPPDQLEELLKKEGH
jgi:hypothetical protein